MNIITIILPRKKIKSIQKTLPADTLVTRGSTSYHFEYMAFEKLKVLIKLLKEDGKKEAFPMGQHRDYAQLWRTNFVLQKFPPLEITQAEVNKFFKVAPFLAPPVFLQDFSVNVLTSRRNYIYTMLKMLFNDSKFKYAPHNFKVKVPRFLKITKSNFNRIFSSRIFLKENGKEAKPESYFEEECSKLFFPLICKPISAGGTFSSHFFVLLFSKAQLASFNQKYFSKGAKKTASQISKQRPGASFGREVEAADLFGLHLKRMSGASIKKKYNLENLQASPLSKPKNKPEPKEPKNSQKTLFKGVNKRESNGFILQQFYNHQGRLLKVYVVGKKVYFDERLSLPDMGEDLYNQPLFFHNSFQSSVFRMKSLEGLRGGLSEEEKDVCRFAALRVQEKTKAVFFGLDIIMKNKTAFVIDINCFPNFSNIDDLAEGILDVIEDK